MFLYHRRILSLPAPTGSLSFQTLQKATPPIFFSTLFDFSSHHLEGCPRWLDRAQTSKESPYTCKRQNLRDNGVLRDEEYMNAQSTSAWQSLLANLGPREHAVQIYQDDNFFGNAVSHFTMH